MKKVLMLMLGLIAGTASFANNKQEPVDQAPQTNLVVTADQKIKLYVNALPVKARIELKDAAGHVLYAENRALTKGLLEQFDIAGLETGTYHLDIITGQHTQTKTFVIQPVPISQKIITVDA